MRDEAENFKHQLNEVTFSAADRFAIPSTHLCSLYLILLTTKYIFLVVMISSASLWPREQRAQGWGREGEGSSTTIHAVLTSRPSDQN